VLIADDTNIQVWDVNDPAWTATIAKAGEEVKMTSVEFGQNGDEVVAFSDSNLRVSIWNLTSGKCVKIRDPKFTTKGHGWRPRTGHLALLARPAAQDIIMVHAPTSYQIINQNVLPNFDAQGLKWSPDGRWIAVWDAASRGFSLDIYTPDGHLYRNCSRKPEQDVDGLGVKTVEWSSLGDILAVGDFDNKITLLSHLTVGSLCQQASLLPTLLSFHPNPSSNIPRFSIHLMHLYGKSWHMQMSRGNIPKPSKP
jgi:WD40 repeat protein